MLPNGEITHYADLFAFATSSAVSNVCGAPFGLLVFLVFFRPLSSQTIASSALVISLSIVFPVGVPSSVRLLCRTMTARLLRFSVFYLFSAQPPDVLPLCANTAEQMIIVYGQVFNMFGKEYHNRDVAKLRAKGARAV